MKTVNLNFPITDLEGNVINNAGKVVGKVLSLQTKTTVDPIKFHEWSLEFYNGRSVNMDTSDHRTLTDFVKGCEYMTVEAKGPILKYLMAVPEESEPKNQG